MLQHSTTPSGVASPHRNVRTVFLFNMRGVKLPVEDWIYVVAVNKWARESASTYGPRPRLKLR
jgi:hypothetical protein